MRGLMGGEVRRTLVSPTCSSSMLEKQVALRPLKTLLPVLVSLTRWKAAGPETRGARIQHVRGAIGGREELTVADGSEGASAGEELGIGGLLAAPRSKCKANAPSQRARC